MNNFAQSNLGREPPRGAVAHVRRRPHWLQYHAPNSPQKYPFRGPIPKLHYLPHPWTRLTYDPKRHLDPIRRFATVHWTDRPTDARTDRQTDRSFRGKFDDYRPLRYESDAA